MENGKPVLLHFAMSISYSRTPPLFWQFASLPESSEFSYESRNCLGFVDFSNRTFSGPASALSVRDGRHIWS